MMKKFLMMAALVVATLSVSAQDYNWAVGIRGGGFSGVTVKKNNGNNAIEAGVSFSGGGLAVDAVYEWQKPVISEGFHLYYGAGAYTHMIGNYLGLGLEGVVGLEYRLPIDFPLALSLDYRPGFDLLGGAGFFGSNFGFGVKYCF